MGLGIGGTVIAKARAVIEADTKHLDKGLSESEKKFKKWNAVAVKASLAVTGALVIGAKQWIQAASDLNEEVNKVNVVFGKSGKSIEEWSKTSATAFGQSRTQALRFAGSFGALLRPMGLSEKAAGRMSKQLVQLGGDLASFYNSSPEDALAALQSGLTGQVRPLRQFGVFLDKNRIAAEALSSGLVKANVSTRAVGEANQRVSITHDKLEKATKKHGAASIQARQASLSFQKAQDALTKTLHGHIPQLTAAQKAQATYNIILHDTKLAQGDFARTADGAANSQRILAAQTENMKEKLGQSLMPAYMTFLHTSMKIVDIMDRHEHVTKIVIGVLGSLAAAVLIVNAGMKIHAAYTAASTAAQAAFNAVMDANPVVLVIAAIVALGIALVVAYKKSETFRDIVNTSFRVIKKVAETVFNFIRDHWRAILMFMLGVLGVVIVQIIDHWKTIGPIVAKVARFCWDVFKRAFQFIANGVLGFAKVWLSVWEKITGALAHLPGKFGAPFRAANREIKHQLDNLQAAIDKINGKTAGANLEKQIGDAVVNLRHRQFPAIQLPVDLMFPSGGAMPGKGDGAVGAFGGAGTAPRSDVTPGLWDELAIARAGGLSVSSTYRPGAITATGQPSLHGMFPAHAFDSTDGTNAGWGSSRMRAVFQAFIGRPGISEVLLSPYAWYPGSGITRISNPELMREHYSHVHVGSVSGDGLVGRGGVGMPRRGTSAFSGDGRVGAHGSSKPKAPKVRHKKSPRSPLKALMSRYSKRATGEGVIDTMIAAYNAQDQRRQNMERDYSTRDSELALNDPASFIIKRKAIDPVTGLEYSYDEVDYAAISQESSDQDALMALQNEIKAVTLDMKRKAEAIRDKVAAVVRQLQAAINKAIAQKTAYQREVDRVTRRLGDLEGNLKSERRKKKPSKSIEHQLEDEIASQKKALSIAKANFADAEKVQQGFETRRDNVKQAGPEFGQKAIDLGYDARDIDVKIAQLQKQKDDIVGTHLDDGMSQDEVLAQLRKDNPGTTAGSSVGDLTGGGGGSTAAEVEAQIQERLRAEADAILGARSRFNSDFASNVFAPTSGAGGVVMNSGAASGRTVQVVQNFTQPPEDPFVWLKKSQFAAENVFGAA